MLAAFISLMNDIFKSFMDSFVFMLIDDIIVYCKIKEDHATQLRIVLEILREKSLFTKLAKSEF